MTGELVFAVGDIHGRLDLVWTALDFIAARAVGRSHKVIFLGDYIDRGPDSKGVVELMLELQSDHRVVCLKGNHEALMVQALTGDRTADFDRWMEVGGKSTIKSYGASSKEHATTVVPTRHLRWMASLPLTSGDGHRVYVHAGLMPNTPLERQTEAICLYIRDLFLRAGPQQFDTHVVHGHTPAWDGERGTCVPELLSHRTNLDLASYITDRLGVGVFESGKAGGPIEVLIVHGPLGGPIKVSAWNEPPLRRPKSTEAPKLRLRWGKLWGG